LRSHTQEFGSGRLYGERIADEDGRAFVDIGTSDIYTKGAVLCDRHYGWHIRFDQDDKVAEVKTWILEKVLGE
jgi:hypothetical protein